MLARWRVRKNYHRLIKLKSFSMKNVQRWQVIAVTALVVLAAVSIFTYTSTTQAPTRSESIQGSITLTVEGFAAPFHASISEGETVLEVLQDRATEDSDFGLVTKEYSGLGTLVEEIHGMKNGTDNKYWQYKVNGVMPQVGAASLILHDGDSVEWFFAASAF